MYDGYYLFSYNVGGNLSTFTLQEASDDLMKELRNRIGTSLEQFGDKGTLMSYEEGNWHEEDMANFIEDQGLIIEEVTEDILEHKGITFEELKEYGW